MLKLMAALLMIGGVWYVASYRSVTEAIVLSAGIGAFAWLAFENLKEQVARSNRAILKRLGDDIP